MTEIPEHLLKRSKERKAAMSGETPAAEETSSAVAPVESAAPAVAPAPVPEVAPEPEPVRVAPYVEAFEGRRKMPFWIIPVLLFLPVWGAMYFGTLERVPQGLTGLLGEGEEIYIESGCSGCHGAEGGGGIGPAFSDGEINITFTSIEDQMVWIAQGSAIVGTGIDYSSPGDPAKPVAGGMPSFGLGASGALDVEQLLAVTLFERTQFEPDEEAGERDLVLSDTIYEMIESGELEEILAEDDLSIHDVLDPDGLTSADVARYLEPARAALLSEES